MYRRRECSTATTSSVSPLGANWSCGSCHLSRQRCNRLRCSLSRHRHCSDCVLHLTLLKVHGSSGLVPSRHQTARFACWSSSGRGGPSTESSCSVINSWNKFTAAATLSQKGHRTGVKCRMWICSEMLVLTWMYFSSHRPLHPLLTLYNQTCLSGKKSRTVRITHRKNGITNIIQPSTLSPCLTL